MNKPIYSIVGPTASGKTEIGVALALAFGKDERFIKELKSLRRNRAKKNGAACRII
jgi:DNA helicase TIP49 (TBP-interacting protein)